MTKEEILEKSRKESNGKDEREQQVELKGGYLAGRVSKAILVLLIGFLKFSDASRSSYYTLFFVYSVYATFYYGYQAYHLKKRSWWVHTALIAFGGLFFLYLILRDPTILG